MHLPPRSALSACMEQTKHMITMTCSDATKSNTEYRGTDKMVEHPTWNVVHNVKPDGSTGLSGGWRGFAIDNVSRPPFLDQHLPTECLLFCWTSMWAVCVYVCVCPVLDHEAELQYCQLLAFSPHTASHMCIILLKHSRQ